MREVFKSSLLRQLTSEQDKNNSPPSRYRTVDTSLRRLLLTCLQDELCVTGGAA
jgi:hypothetical protein